MIESNFEKHTVLFELFRQKTFFSILKCRCSQEILFGSNMPSATIECNNLNNYMRYKHSNNVIR